MDANCPIPSLLDNARPSWVSPLYDESALTVTPLLIDVQALIAGGDVDQLMSMWNCRRPQLHVSIINSNFSLSQIAIHLQQFIYITTNFKEVFTFRFADCAVLECLPDHLTSEQWQAMTRPIARWAIHGRNGRLRDLPLVNDNLEPSIIPLHLEDKQVKALKDALFADCLIYQLRRIRPTQIKLYDGTELHALVKEAYRLWQISGNSDQLLLLDFLLGAIDTDGRILRMSGVVEILSQSSVEAVRSELNKAISRNSF